MDQGIVDFCGSTTATAATKRLSEALRVNKVELFLLWIKRCGTKVYGSSGTKVQLGKQILQNSNVEVRFSPRVSPTELSRQVIRGLRIPAGVLKTCWEDLSQFLRECLSKGLHLSGWQKHIRN